MTYDELLAKINKVFDEPHIRPDFTPIQAVEALKAIVEMHQPMKHCDNPNCRGPVCSECGSKETVQIGYPCLTIQAIEEKLK
jgi:hypothetical protein